MRPPFEVKEWQSGGLLGIEIHAGHRSVTLTRQEAVELRRRLEELLAGKVWA